MKPAIIALLTDFGQEDPYVGVMKGVIMSLAPEARLIDLTHQVPMGDIQRGAFILWQASLDLPSGTVFLAVIDPGVGTERKGLFLQCGDHRFIGPDNGLFSYLFYQHKPHIWELSNPDYYYRSSGTSSTFHGRDIFAPAAAHAARGVQGERFGARLATPITLPKPQLSLRSKGISGEVISADRFGNLFTSIGQFTSRDQELLCDSWISGESIALPAGVRLSLKIQDLELPFVTTFGSIARGDCAGLIGSTGLVEIVSNQGSAMSRLGLKIGDPVSLVWE
jgi:S-adenosylmethionine hydrolase